ncbi:aldose epimerase family protein [Caulobacter sp. S45]|uniref:aldose epimerase family protein n=1 Tax=Caulobacter sp. S45 TaxID=1641861 RepID=UPI00131A8FDE|nr:aldose epimerase family protein [Caulobacter sp. S45]
MSVTSFGKLPDGREVQLIRLGRPGGLQVEVLDYGATVQRLCAPTKSGCVETVPTYLDLAGHLAGTGYLNAGIGRYANRLAGGRFSIDGRAYQVSVNEGGNTLHGGKIGFDKRLWRIAHADDERAVLAYTSPDGEEGFPGRLEVEASYTVSHDALTIAYRATTDQPTPVNLTQHFYFNLSGRPSRSILDHQLRLAGEAITVVGDGLIPTGELRPVADTVFDLRRTQRVGDLVAAPDPQIVMAKGIDHNWVLDRGPEPQVELHSPESGLTLHLATDQPGMQVYSGQGMGAPFFAHAAIAFEPQGFPDAPNHPNFPDTILRPGQTYRHTSTYRFTH